MEMKKITLKWCSGLENVDAKELEKYTIVYLVVYQWSTLFCYREKYTTEIHNRISSRVHFYCKPWETKVRYMTTILEDGIE